MYTKAYFEVHTDYIPTPQLSYTISLFEHSFHNNNLKRQHAGDKGISAPVHIHNMNYTLLVHQNIIF